MLETPNYNKLISTDLGISFLSVEIVLELVAEGATVPFIARYRKEKTGGLDENNIRDIIDLRSKLEQIFKAKQTAIKTIEELGLMTPDLLENILKATTLKQVEEIYKPYKSKKKTKAMLAIEKGFQIAADVIKKNMILDFTGNVGLCSLHEQYPIEEIIEGAQHIIAAEISANADLRADLIETLQQYGSITSKIKGKIALAKLNEKDTGQISKFELYKDFSLTFQRLKPYQILALNRGEKLGILNVKIDKTEKTFEGILLHYARILAVRIPFLTELTVAFTLGYDALFKSVENELRGMLNEEGEDDAIETFRKNLGQLLMTKPEYGKVILALDPGFRAGCKLCVLDTGGNPIFFDKIFLYSPEEAEKKLKKIIESYKIEVIVVGNGTGVDETVALLQTFTEINIFIVNESGASVYSASKIASEEFPNLDSLDRGTVSIGRRFIDPLSELVKIPVGSIGVGMYQHDIPEKKLEEKLGYVVEDTVNEIGINVNTASAYVLQYISGIGKVAAKKIYNNRPYASRKDLKKQLSPSIYQQAAGFLRVPESKELLDITDIHPEQYDIAKHIMSAKIEQHEIHNYFAKEKQTLQSLYSDVSESTLEFIISSLKQAGKEKRIHSSHQKAIKKGEDTYKVGDIVSGVIRNVVAFGAFVDIGMKQDGLIHVSQIADRFISDPREELEVSQNVKVKITAIDEVTGKIQLSMKQAQ